MFKKIIFFLLISIFFNACNYFTPKNDVEKKIIASVGDVNLYQDDIKVVISRNIKKEDSILRVKEYINNWAKQQLLFQNAQLNLSDEQAEIDKLVKKYKQDLLINKYKEALVSKNLDTIIKEYDISEFYAENKDIFKLNEKLIQLKFLQITKDAVDLKDILKMFTSDKQEDLDSLKSRNLEFKAYHLEHDEWIKYSDVAKMITPFKSIDEKLIQENKFIQKEDSLDIYVFKINKLLNRNQIAPKSYVEPTIKQMILHNRKLKVLKNIEKTILNDAVKNGKFKIYE